MKIIDAAVQPPVEDILKTGLYDGPGPASGRYRRDQALDPAYLLKSLDLFLKDQRSTGVVASIVSALAPVVTFDAYANLTGPMTEFPNEQVAAICDELDGFYGLASVNPADNPNAVDDLVHWLDHGMLGVKLYPGWFAEPLHCDNEILYPIYETCAARNVPAVILHGGFSGPDLSYTDPVHIERVAMNFPTLKIIVAHGGFPYIQQITGLLYRRRNIWLQPDMYFPGMPGQQDLILAMSSYARERVIYTSSYPFTHGRDQLDRIRALGLTDTVLQRFLHDNAAEAYGLADRR
ncbi:MAG: amidohydrolase family protein [Phycicoccus sp.]|nr:amidohydrolase family protein [Phycicoccus sp.]